MAEAEGEQYGFQNDPAEVAAAPAQPYGSYVTANETRDYLLDRGRRDGDTSEWQKFKNLFTGGNSEKGDPGLEFDIIKSENGFVEILPTGMFILSILMWIFLLVGIPLLWYSQQKFYRQLSTPSEADRTFYDASTGIMAVSMVFLVLLTFLYLRNYRKKSFNASRKNIALLGARINSKLYADASGQTYYQHAAYGMQNIARSAQEATSKGLANYHLNEAARASVNAGGDAQSFAEAAGRKHEAAGGDLESQEAEVARRQAAEDLRQARARARAAGVDDDE